MNSTHGITAENLLYTLPPVLQNDQSMAALASSIANILAARPAEIESLIIYTRIDELPEALLNILAEDFKVDWWDADYTLEEKRKTLKDSWHIHRKLGTKAAVKAALSAIYPNAEVMEWFEYGGKPHHFRLLISTRDGELDPIKHKKVLDRVDYYKNLRSYLEAIEYHMPPATISNISDGLLFRILHLSITIINFGTKLALLNGGKMLDGSWLLNQHLSGIGFHQFRVTSTLPEQETAHLFGLRVGPFPIHRQKDTQMEFQPVRVQFQMPLPNVPSGKLVLLDGRKQLDGNWKLEYGFHSVKMCFTWQAKARQSYQVSATLIQDSMWRLDSTLLLDGGRKLNAAIIKERI